MGFLKDAGDSFLRYSEIVVNKTEMYSKIAKLKLDIRRNENEMEETHKKLGALVLEAAENGADSLSMNDDNVKELLEKVSNLKESTELKNREIDTIKQSPSSPDEKGKI